MSPTGFTSIGSTSESDPQNQLHQERFSTLSTSKSDLHQQEQSSPPYDWLRESINGGSLRHIDLDGSNGWASPPAHLFNLRSQNYLSSRQKSPSGSYLLKPAGVDWLRSRARLDNLLGRPNNRIMKNLRRAQAQNLDLSSFLLAINLQIPSGNRKVYSSVFYFAAQEPIKPNSLLHRFINGNDAFRNSTFKIVNRILKGPWIVQKTVGKYAACILGKALKCSYYRGDDYLEIDVDIGSSEIASAAVLLALGFVEEVRVDLGFVVEAQSEEELPERLMGAVRISQMQMKSAQFVESQNEENGK